MHDDVEVGLFEDRMPRILSLKTLRTSLLALALFGERSRLARKGLRLGAHQDFFHSSTNGEMRARI